MNGTLQDRLVKAMRRANVCDLERANRFLEEEFLSPFNERFMVPAEKSGDFHRPLSKTTDLARILAVQEERVVQNDWTVRWRNRFLQLSRETAALVQPGMKVTVCELLDGSLRLFHGETELPWSSTRSEPVIERKREGEIRSNQGQRPAADHPWRKLRPYRRSKPAPPPNPISPELASSAPDSLRSSSAALANSDSS
jgi:hypothetical protein